MEDLFGLYRVKALMMIHEASERFASREEIEQMEDNEQNEDYKDLMRMFVEIAPDLLKVKIKVTPAELEQAKEEEPDVEVDEDRRITLEKHEMRQVDGVYQYECGEEDGAPFFAAFERNEDGDLLYGQAIVLERV